ncbi:hypothetical protein QWZ13_19070 [Reinekea marina]|nr:hypothetical protein [Reinekea marina]MDN3651016.1 hypothetical protein [Reinekea marina]
MNIGVDNTLLLSSSSKVDKCIRLYNRSTHQPKKYTIVMHFSQLTL